MLVTGALLPSLLLLPLGCPDKDPGTAPPDETATPGDIELDVAVQSEALDSMVLARRFTVQTSRPASVALGCVASADEVEERHLVTSVTFQQEQQLIIYGLLAETTYTCSVEAAAEDGTSGSTQLQVAIGALPFGLPAWTVDPLERDRTWGAYTLFSTNAQDEEGGLPRLLMVDLDGRLRWYHFLDAYTSQAASSVDASYLGDGRFLFGGGYAIAPTIVELDGGLLYQAPDPSNGGAYHHHVELLDSGRIAGLTAAENTHGGEKFTGFAVVVHDPETGEETFTWSSQQALDAGTLEPDEGQDTGQDPDTEDDPFHANALSIVDSSEPAGGLWVSLRRDSEMLRIDQDTGEIVARLGPSGDYTLLDEGGEPAEDERWFYNQHDPEFHGDKVLLYDNGGDRPGEAYSQALELQLDHERRQAQITWSWTEQRWREKKTGDADLLDNGNVLIAMGHTYRDRGEDERSSALVEVERDGDEVVWRLEFDEPTDGIYKAERIDGCAVLNHLGYCPSLAR